VDIFQMATVGSFTTDRRQLDSWKKAAKKLTAGIQQQSAGSYEAEYGSFQHADGG
jgi:hypothetical protein